jgi:hypothetical protein
VNAAYRLEQLAGKQKLSGLNRHERRQAAALLHGQGGDGWRVKRQRIGEAKARQRRAAEACG